MRLVSEEDVLSVILFSKLFDDAKCGEVREAMAKIHTIEALPVDVLNKIKDDIHSEIEDVGNGPYSDGLYTALEIINKYLEENK